MKDRVGQEVAPGDFVAHISPTHGSTYVRIALVLDVLPTKKKSLHVQYGQHYHGLWIPKQNNLARSWDAAETKIFPHTAVLTRHEPVNMLLVCPTCDGHGHTGSHPMPE